MSRRDNMIPPEIYTRYGRGLLYMLIAGAVLIITLNTQDSTLLKPAWVVALSAALFSLGAFSLFAGREVKIAVTPSHILAILYIVLSFCSLSKAANQRLGWEALLIMCCYLTVFWSTYVLVDSAEEFKRLLIVIFSVTAIACTVGLFLQYVRPSSFSILATEGRQIISTFGNASYFSGFLVAVIPLLVSKLSDHSSSTMSRALLATLLLAVIVLLIQAQTRTSWFAAVIALCVLVFVAVPTSKSRWLLFGGAAFICIILLISTDIIQHRLANLFVLEPASTFARRLFMYQGAWNAFLASPLLGNGVGNFVVFLPKFRSPEYWVYRSEDIAPHAHNEFLEILSETGIAGFLPWIVLLCYLTYRFIKKLQLEDQKGRLIFSGVWCSLLGILIDNFGSMSLRTVPVALLFWIFIAVIARRVDGQRFTLSFRLPEFFIRLKYLPIVLYGVFLLVFVPRQIDRVVADGYALEGDLLHFVDHSPVAISRYEQALAHNPHQASVRFNIASSLYENKQYTSARDHALALLKDYPWFPQAHLVVAIASTELTGQKNGDLSDTATAFRHFAEEIRLRNHPQVYYFLSLLYRKLSDRKREMTALEAMLKQSIVGEEKRFVTFGLLRTVELCPEVKDCDHIIEVVYSIEEAFSSDVTILMASGDVVHAYGMREKAKEFYERASQLDPTNGDVRARMRMIEMENPLRKQK